MDLFCGAGRWRVFSATLAVMAVAGCASPGPPKAPSLQMPAPVTDLSAARVGDSVALRFTVPQRSTDKLPLREATVRGSLCREVDHQKCLPVAGLRQQGVPVRNGAGLAESVVWHDALPVDLASGTPRLLGYRVEFFSPGGRSGGVSEPAFVASGAGPESVQGLRAEGSRAGIVVSWSGNRSGDGDVIVRRKDTQAAPAAEAKDAKAPVGLAVPGGSKGSKKPKEAATPGEVWLTPETGGRAGQMLDASAMPEVPYTYSAVRRRFVQIGGRTLEVRSEESPAVAITWREVYPPAAPTGLVAVGFEAAGGFAVDLIWQPVIDAKVTGYKVYRSPSDADGRVEKMALLGTVTQPAFHDTEAKADGSYVYRVTAVDAKGNESAGVTTLLHPQ